MSQQSYKQWTIAVLFTVIVIALVLSLKRSPSTTEESQSQDYPTPSVSGSLIEFNAKEQQYLEIIRNDPQNIRVRARLADLYFESSMFEKAITAYKELLELDDTDGDTYNDLGLSYHYSGRSDLAIETLRKGAEVASSFQRIWLSLGFVLAANNKADEARTSLKKAIQLDSETDVATEARRILGILDQSG
jgi:tetratricopeptide (TPR) repeat protein